LPSLIFSKIKVRHTSLVRCMSSQRHRSLPLVTCLFWYDYWKSIGWFSGLSNIKPDSYRLFSLRDRPPKWRRCSERHFDTEHRGWIGSGTKRQQHLLFNTLIKQQTPNRHVIR